MAIAALLYAAEVDEGIVLSGIESHQIVLRRGGVRIGKIVVKSVLSVKKPSLLLTLSGPARGRFSW